MKNYITMLYICLGICSLNAAECPAGENYDPVIKKCVRIADKDDTQCRSGFELVNGKCVPILGNDVPQE